MGVRKNFARISSNFPEKFSGNFSCKDFLPHTFWGDFQKNSSCDSPLVGRQSNNVGCQFCAYFQVVCPDFQVVCPDFQVVCPDFQVFCPDFRHIKRFGGALSPLNPPPTPLMVRAFGKTIRNCFYSRFCFVYGNTFRRSQNNMITWQK